METKAFFGPNGLTSTSANHYANLAKEANRPCVNYLCSVQFYSESIGVIGTNEQQVTQTGMGPDELQNIQKTISDIAARNSLAAFFREAIKEKERLSRDAQSWKDERGRAEFDERVKELTARKPVRAPYLTEEDVKRSWSVGEQEKFLSLEAEAAVLGKFIHEDGPLSNARIDLMQKMSHPRSVKENGRDTIIYSYVPTVGLESVDEMYFSLQQRHREVQAELNGMKKRIEDARIEQSRQVDEEYALALNRWNAEKRALDAEFQEFLEDESRSRTNRMQQAQSLKIVVPNRLKEVFESLK